MPGPFPISSPLSGGMNMPSAIPGLGGPPPGAAPSGPGAPPLGGGGPPPSMFGMPAPNDPASSQYEAKTQSDGTVLLYQKLPDGSLGPIIKIVKVGGKGGGGAA